MSEQASERASTRTSGAERRRGLRSSRRRFPHPPHYLTTAFAIPTPANAPAHPLPSCVRCLEPGADLFLCDRCPRTFCCSCFGVASPPPEDPWFCGECAAPVPAAAREASQRVRADAEAFHAREREREREREQHGGAAGAAEAEAVAEAEAEAAGGAGAVAAMDEEAAVGAGAGTGTGAGASPHVGPGHWFGAALWRPAPPPPANPAGGVRWQRVGAALGLDAGAVGRRFRMLVEGENEGGRGRRRGRGRGSRGGRKELARSLPRYLAPSPAD